MKKLKNILYGLELIAVRGSNEIMISGISIDSKKIYLSRLMELMKIVTIILMKLLKTGQHQFYVKKYQKTS
mgnify:CR=1 FL=1